MEDCLSCYNGTNLTMTDSDSGKCIYPGEEHRGERLGPVLDWIREYLGWIVLILFVSVSSVLIYAVWYTCCREPSGAPESPVKGANLPHLELHEENPPKV